MQRDTETLIVRRARVRNVICLLRLYYRSMHRDTYPRNMLLLQRAAAVGERSGLQLWLGWSLYLLLCRLQAITDCRSIHGLFSHEQEPEMLEIVLNSDVIGWASLNNRGRGVSEVDGFGLLDPWYNDTTSELAARSIMRYVSRLGKRRVLVRSSLEGFDDFMKCGAGFRRLFTDDVLYVDLVGPSAYGISKEMSSEKLEVRCANLRELPAVYSVVLQVFGDSAIREAYILPKSAERQQLPTSKGLLARLIHIAETRLTMSYRLASPLPLFQHRWDPIALVVLLDGELVGACFVLRLDPVVVELGIIGILREKRGQGIGQDAVSAVFSFVMRMGAKRCVVGTGPTGTGGFYRKCGFRPSHSEQVLSIDMADQETKGVLQGDSKTRSGG